MLHPRLLSEGDQKDQKLKKERNVIAWEGKAQQPQHHQPQHQLVNIVESNNQTLHDDLYDSTKHNPAVILVCSTTQACVGQQQLFAQAADGYAARVRFFTYDLSKDTNHYARILIGAKAPALVYVKTSDNDIFGVGYFLRRRGPFDLASMKQMIEDGLNETGVNEASDEFAHGASFELPNLIYFYHQSSEMDATQSKIIDEVARAYAGKLRFSQINLDEYCDKDWWVERILLSTHYSGPRFPQNPDAGPLKFLNVQNSDAPVIVVGRMTVEGHLVPVVSNLTMQTGYMNEAQLKTFIETKGLKLKDPDQSRN